MRLKIVFLRPQNWSRPKPYYYSSANRALGRKVPETKSQKGRIRDRKPFLHRVCNAQGGIEAKVA